jgi:L-iditol 2-dehydrogenase
MKMKAYLYYEPGVIQYTETEIPEIKNGEVLVKVDTALTCGTDIKTYRRGHPLLIKSTPSGFGHEFAGTIVKIGHSVERFKPGQRIVAANSAPCMACHFCNIGRFNLCDNLELLNGAYAEYIVIPENIVRRNMYILPDHLSFEEAACTEPLANVLNGVDKSDICAGKVVGVVGLGPIGLMFVRMAKLKGAQVIAMGRNPLKLKLAKEFGDADEVVNLTDHKDPEAYVRSLTPESKGLDVSIEAVGLPQIWEKAIALTRKGGTINLFGGCESGTTISIDTRRLHYDELKIVSVFHHTPYYFARALQMIADRQMDVKKLITETMPLSELQTALEKYEQGKVIKVAIKP